MQPRRREAVLSLLLAPLSALAREAQDGKDYEPKVGQAGKDVIWVPTPDALVERMLDMAQVKAGDVVVDLGSGDGKIAIAAAKRGAKARGIEFNRDMVALSRRKAREANVKVDFVHGDIFKSDFSQADVVTMYLLPELNERLRPTLLRMKPGTRVTSHEFAMGDWQPDRTESVESRRALLWIVPARVAGDWNVRVTGEPPLHLELRQQYQKLEGHATVDGQRLALLEPSLHGAQLHFAIADEAGGARRFEGAINPRGGIGGAVVSADGQSKTFAAVRS